MEPIQSNVSELRYKREVTIDFGIWNRQLGPNRELIELANAHLIV